MEWNFPALSQTHHISVGKDIQIAILLCRIWPKFWEAVLNRGKWNECIKEHFFSMKDCGISTFVIKYTELNEVEKSSIKQYNLTLVGEE